MWLQVLGIFEGKPSLPVINPRLSEIVKETQVSCDRDVESASQPNKCPFALQTDPCNIEDNQNYYLWDRIPTLDDLLLLDV
jgi:hypothetical protein